MGSFILFVHQNWVAIGLIVLLIDNAILTYGKVTGNAYIISISTTLANLITLVFKIKPAVKK